MVVDESMHLDRGLYLLATVRVPPERDDQIRSALRRVCPGRTARLHWHSDTDRVRRRAVEAVAEMGLTATVFVNTVSGAREQERARRACLWQAVYALREEVPCHLLLDRRSSSQNRSDNREISSAIKSMRLGGLTYAHGSSVDEPLLWLPDIVAGVVGAGFRGDRRYAVLLDRLDVTGPP